MTRNSEEWVKGVFFTYLTSLKVRVAYKQGQRDHNPTGPGKRSRFPRLATAAIQHQPESGNARQQRKGRWLWNGHGLDGDGVEVDKGVS